MPVYSKSVQNSFLIIAFLLAFTATSRTSLAEEMSMEAFRAEFQQATGKAWESVTSSEKLDFVHQYQKTVAETLERTRLENFNKDEHASEPSDQSSNLKRSVTVEVRKQFFMENGKEWDDATTEEQEVFLTQYKIQKHEKDQQEKDRTEQEKAIEEAKRQQRQAEIQAAADKKREEESRKAEEARALQEERDEERRKLQESMQRIKDMREEFKAKREESRH